MYCVDKLARPFVLLNILFFQFRCCDERHFLYNTIITLHHWPIAISLLMAFRYILLVAYNSTYFIHWIQDHFTAFRKCDYCQSFVWSGAFGVLNVYYVLSSCVQIYIIKQKKTKLSHSFGGDCRHIRDHDASLHHFLFRLNTRRIRQKEKRTKHWAHSHFSFSLHKQCKCSMRIPDIHFCVANG